MAKQEQWQQLASLLEWGEARGGDESQSEDCLVDNATRAVDVHNRESVTERVSGRRWSDNRLCCCFCSRVGYAVCFICLAEDLSLTLSRSPSALSFQILVCT